MAYSKSQKKLAKQILKVGVKKGATRKQLTSAIATGLVETNLANISGGDADSGGWRQERRMYYDNVMNVKKSAKNYFKEAKAADHGQPGGVLAQDVQRSAYPDRYTERWGEAKKLTSKLLPKVKGGKAGAVGGRGSASKAMKRAGASASKGATTIPAQKAKMDPATLLAFIQQPDKTAADYIGLSQEKQALAAQSIPKQKIKGGFGNEKPVDAALKKGGPVKNKGIVGWAERQVNTQEGSRKQVRWAKNVGVSASLPWCSIFVANALRKNGYKHLPSNPAYSGAWLDWKGGKKTNLKHIKKGDIVVFDWGDGGITDHVAIYAGGGKVIGGNQSDAVTKVPLSKGNVVGVVRPKR
jgi:uncharacterized protein (TIGR02594 family)